MTFTYRERLCRWLDGFDNPVAHWLWEKVFDLGPR